MDFSKSQQEQLKQGGQWFFLHFVRRFNSFFNESYEHYAIFRKIHCGSSIKKCNSIYIVFTRKLKWLFSKPESSIFNIFKMHVEYLLLFSDAKIPLHLVPWTITEILRYYIQTSHYISSLTYLLLKIRRKYEIWAI